MGAAAHVQHRCRPGAWPDATHVACFDTAFHHTLPEEARRLPLPEQVDRLGPRRYGFHGLSHQSIVDATHNLGRAVIAHLGSGCSVTAVHDGHSVHTSMSLTPTGGVMSATRSGDLDPGVPLLLLDQPDATAGTVRDLQRVRRRMSESEQGWRSWSDLQQRYEGPLRALVHHSGVVLQGLSYAAAAR